MLIVYQTIIPTATGEILDFTCFNKYATINPNGYQNAFIGGYKSGNDVNADVEFGRTIETGNGQGLPRGSVRIEHPNPDVFATRLLLPQAGGRERIGVFYCLGEADESENKISTVIMDRSGKIF